MSRHKRHKVKLENAEPSTSSTKLKEDHDLAYFVHDRVELMHQVFSSLKAKEIRSIAPECIRDRSIDEIEEMCLEELLGISSKRLCAVLDGAAPPSDTDSSQASLEAISLDSISSDSDGVSRSSKKKKKHKRHKKKCSAPATHPSAVPGAGVTVLELLELQARARAIRAQLTQQQAEAVRHSSSSSGVEVKEEPPAVVTISSDDDDDKERVRTLIREQTVSSAIDSQSRTLADETQNAEKRAKSPHSKSGKKKKKKNRREEKESESVAEREHVDHDKDKTQNVKEKTTEQTQQSQTTIKRNDFTITMSTTQQPKRKIKLNRNKITVSVPSVANEPKESVASRENVQVVDKSDKMDSKVTKMVKLKKKSSKSKKRNASLDDNDEITLVLSDSEKMDLLEDLDRNNLDRVSSSSDSEASSDTTDSSCSDSNAKDSCREKCDNKNDIKDSNEDLANDNIVAQETGTDNGEKERDEAAGVREMEDVTHEVGEGSSDKEKVSDDKIDDLTVVVADGIVVNSEMDKEVSNDIVTAKETVEKTAIVELQDRNVPEIDVQCSPSKEKDVENDSLTKENSNVQKTPSEDGELTDKSSSEVEAMDVRPEVVCISDEETSKEGKKKKKKKEKKAKKSKKKDFCKESDQNFYKENSEVTVEIKDGGKTSKADSVDDIYEILELSDDSSCYEVEGVSVLSKEPTSDEIAALSAKIDEFERNEIITDEEIRKHDDGSVNEDMTWKDRYLGSKKVKTVLTTANIMNALRKRNRELKKKLLESKNVSQTEITEGTNERVNELTDVELGTIDHYNTLEGSTKYIDPVKEKEIDIPLTHEMKKDAKQLLKMYKRLLKYNDMSKKTEKKKKSKKKKKDSGVASGDK